VETGTHYAELTVERGKAGKERKVLEDDIPCKNILTVNTIAVYCWEGCQHISVEEHMESWCMHMSKHS